MTRRSFVALLGGLAGVLGGVTALPSAATGARWIETMSLTRRLVGQSWSDEAVLFIRDRVTGERLRAVVRYRAAPGRQAAEAQAVLDWIRWHVDVLNRGRRTVEELGGFFERMR